MRDLTTTNQNAVLFHLEDPLASLLAAGLHQAGCKIAQEAIQGAQIVFCAAGSGSLQEALSQFPHVPVVVVSRLPDTDDWLDALEAGAADYCAAPFEPIQLRWLLDAHMRPRPAWAAA
jgi:CheY-like chemotaxis protein